jgi:dTMP kinase
MFVSFEGLDGSGKTTQAELLRARLEADGEDVVATREPGGTPLGEGIRDLVLHGGHVVPWAEVLLYAASRAQHVQEVIRPALGRGATVVCDRYVDSSVAYQGGGRGLGLDPVLELNLTAVDGLLPDATYLLVVSPETAAERMDGTSDRIEREDGAFRERAAAAYRELAARYPDRIRVLDASRAPDDLAEEVYAALRGSS